MKTQHKDTIKDLDKEVENRAKKTVADAKSTVAVIDGNLRDSIHYTLIKKGVKIVADAEYGLIVHENPNTSGEYKYLERAFYRAFGNKIK